MRQAQRGRLGRHRGPTHVSRRRIVQDGVDDAGAVEADHDRQPSGHGGRLEPAGLLQPAHEQFHIDSAGGQRIEVSLTAPAQEDLKVGIGVCAGQSLVPGQIRGYRDAKKIIRGTREEDRTGSCAKHSALPARATRPRRTRQMCATPR